MSKSERELAFLRDLYINSEWTRRFTDLIDKNFDLKHVENLIYINAGTGEHCIELREKADESTAIFAYCDNEELLKIARDKAIAVKSDVEFSHSRSESDAFDAVITDASFVRPGKLPDLLSETVRIARSGGNVAVFLPAAGSFGEIFSLLWEVLFNEDLGEHGATAETMISELPSTNRLIELAENMGIANPKTETANEIFEFENGEAFINSPLIADFLMPEWLKTLNEDETRLVLDKLKQLIDTEYGELPFRFSVKAALLTGKKTVSH